MGVRGELFSSKVMLPNRTYFFNVKENRMGDLYLNIVESKNRDNGGFERQSVILFADDLQEFLKGFDESLKVMEKAVRNKRQNRSNDRGSDGGNSDNSGGEGRASSPRRERGVPGKKFASQGTPRGEHGRPPAKSRKFGNASGNASGNDSDRKPERKYGGSDRGAERKYSGSDRGAERKYGGSDRGTDRKRDGGKRVVVRKR